MGAGACLMENEPETGTPQKSEQNCFGSHIGMPLAEFQ